MHIADQLTRALVKQKHKVSYTHSNDNFTYLMPEADIISAIWSDTFLPLFNQSALACTHKGVYCVDGNTTRFVLRAIKPDS